MAVGAQFGSAANQPTESFPEKLQTGLVTLLFTDIVDSTGLKHRLGDLRGARSIEAHHQLIRDILHQTGAGK